MFEVERKLRVGQSLGEIPPSSSIDSQTYSGSHALYHSRSLTINYVDLMADMVVLAFSTGVSRVGIWAQGLRFIDELLND